MPHANHLRRHRRQWALSQEQVALLLGLRARSIVSKYERGRGTPQLRYALAYQFVFGVRLEDLFPDLSRDVVDRVMQAAARLDEQSRDQGDPAAQRRAEFLRAMIRRATSDEPA